MEIRIKRQKSLCFSSYCYYCSNLGSRNIVTLFSDIDTPSRFAAIYLRPAVMIKDVLKSLSKRTPPHYRSATLA